VFNIGASSWVSMFIRIYFSMIKYRRIIIHSIHNSISHLKNIKTKQAQHVEVLRDIIISSEYSDECETINELMVDDTVNDKGVGVRLLTIHKAKRLRI